MADHRIRLTDREVELHSSAAQSMVWALLPRYPDLAHEYGLLVSRLAHIKAGGMPAASRAARKHFKQEVPVS
jgi:hypothetical protein